MTENLTTIQIICIILASIVILYLIYYFTNKPMSQIQIQHQPQSHPQPQLQSQSQPEFTLFNFYSPTCPHSKQFNTTWAQLVNKLGSMPNLNLKAVDSSDPQNQNLAFYYNVTEVPTIILVGPTKNELYTGSRDLESIKGFLSKKMNN